MVYFHDKIIPRIHLQFFPSVVFFHVFFRSLTYRSESQTVYPLDELHQLSCLLSYPSKELFLLLLVS